MKRILFVDDEPRILDGLQRMLRARRNEWDTEFAVGGAEALVRMAAAPFDVIVTDMRMPGLDGAELLQIVHDRYPNTIRIILSGQTDPEATLRTVGLAHQFLLKPCDQSLLSQVIDRVCALAGLLNDAALISIVGGVECLPTTPSLYAALGTAVNDPSAPLSRIVAIVERDAAISAKVLQLVNSAFFGLSHRLTTLESAVSYLGLAVVRAIVLSQEVFHGLGLPSVGGLLDLEAEQHHAVLVANVARQIATEVGRGDEAFVAGMLHDVGKLVLALRMPERLAAIDRDVRLTLEPMYQVELRHGFITHAEVGAYLLGLWGLPYGIVEAVAHHHAPERVEPVELDAIGAVHIADALVHAVQSPERAEPLWLNRHYVTRLGLDDELPRWLAMAGEQWHSQAPLA